MDSNLKELFTKCFSIVKENTDLIKADFDKNSLNEREKLWNNVSPAFYVIGSEKTKKYFDEESERLGFKKLLSYITPREEAFVKNIFKNNQEMGSLQKWATSVNPEQGKNMGCHFSHVIAAIDMIENNYTHAFVFEDDCKFKFDISDNFLSRLSEYIKLNIDKIPYLNIGSRDTVKINYEEFNVTKRSSSLTHSYIMNLDCAKKLRDSVDVNIDIPKPLDMYFAKEQYYRGGADDFFYSYIESYVMNPAITYQQFIGTNIERKT